MLKGYRTYLAIILTALIVGLNQLGIVSGVLYDTIVGLLVVAGIYYRAKV